MSRGLLALCAGLAGWAWGCGPSSEPAGPSPASAAASTATASAPASLAASTPPTAPAPPTPETLPEGTPTQLAALNGAKAALAAGKERDALALFRQATEGGMTGTSVSAALALGELLTARGQDAEALALYRELVGRARFIPEVQYTAARFFWLHGDDRGAQTALEAALGVQPDFLPAWRLLGMAQARAGRNTEAGRTLAEYELRLGRMSRRAVDAHIAAGERLAAFQMLSMLDDDRAVSTLVDGLRDADPGVRSSVADLLADEPAPEALSGLSAAALAEKDPDVRLHMAAVLAEARARARAMTATPLPALPKPVAAPPDRGP